MNPDADLVFDFLLDTIEKQRDNSVACCWGLSTSPGVSFSGDYRKPLRLVCRRMQYQALSIPYREYPNLV